MNYKDITVIIVTYKSKKVIFNCLKSIKNIKNIIIVDNSNDSLLKKKVLSKFPNVNYILSLKNLGYGAGNNLALKKLKTKYALILNPDTILIKKCEFKLLMLAKFLRNNFAIIAPSLFNKKINYGMFSKKKYNFFEKKNNFLKVDYVKGFAMLLNLKKIRKINFFDENFFLYMEEIDLCKRLRNLGENIFVSTEAKVKHLGAKSSNLGFDLEINRNWHWMWSKVYYSSKHHGFLKTRFVILPLLFKLFFKYLLYVFFFNRAKLAISNSRLRGCASAFLNFGSSYRIKKL